MFREARDEVVESLSLVRRLGADRPGAFAKELASIHMNLGTTYAEMGQYQEAEQSLKEALFHLGLDPRPSGEPETGSLRHLRAAISMNLGIVLPWRRRFADARSHLGRALELLHDSRARQPASYRTEIAAIHTHLGNLEWRGR